MIHIRDLHYGCDGEALQLRILRKWIPHFRDKETWFLAVDKYGDSITIVGQKQGQKFLESNLQIGGCYCIEQYTCSETSKFQRMIKNEIHMNAGEASKIIRIEETQEIPQTCFSFATADQFRELLKNPSYYPDFCGRYKRQTAANKKDGDPYLLLGLTDVTGQEMIVTLWKECIENPEKLNHASLSATTTDTIIVVTNVKPSIFADNLRLSSTDATHVIIDPPMDIESEHYQEITEAPTETSLGTKYNVMTLQELQSSEYQTLLRKPIAVDARITDTIIENSWYTALCPDCGGQISKNKRTWFCPNHGPKSDPYFFYNIRVVLSDGTTTVEATASDSCIQKIIGRSCKQIVMEDSYEDRKTLPPAFKREAMNTHRFHIEMTNKSTPNNINFIILNKESLPPQSPPSQTIMTISEHPYTPTTETEVTDTTPPPHTSTTPSVINKSTTAATSRTDKNTKPIIARQLSFEQPAKEEISKETSPDTNTKPKRKDTKTPDATEQQMSKKPTTTKQKEKLEAIKPAKRERYPD